MLGFPANDFAGQEPGSNGEIATFCRSTFGVNFPMFAKIAVTGPAIHPLYQALIAAEPKAAGATREAFRAKLAGFLGKNGATPNPEPGILWNFEKFLIDRTGKVVARFSPEVVPDIIRRLLPPSKPRWRTEADGHCACPSPPGIWKQLCRRWNSGGVPCR